LLSGRVVANASGEVANGDELLVRLEQALNETFEVEPEVASALLADAEVEVEAIDIGGCVPRHGLAPMARRPLRKRGSFLISAPS
jgi:hypothetical protein